MSPHPRPPSTGSPRGSSGRTMSSWRRSVRALALDGRLVTNTHLRRRCVGHHADLPDDLVVNLLAGTAKADVPFDRCAVVIRSRVGIQRRGALVAGI